MSKSNAEAARESMARRRVRARAAGFCYTCCKRRPHAGRAICTACNAANVERKKLRRQRNRGSLRVQRAIAIRERAGDEARTYHLYGDATRYYQEALNIPLIAQPDRARIAEKIGQAFFLNGNLQAANEWFERLVGMYRSNREEAFDAVEALTQIYRQLMLNCRGQAMLATVTGAVHIAEISGDPELTKLANLRKVEALMLMSRYGEALNVLREVGEVGQRSDLALRSQYHATYATACVITGDAESAYQNFETALELTKKDADPYRLVVLWTRYGCVAQELGDTIRAKTCFEQALFVSRQYRVTWLIAMRSLRYAKLLGYVGQYSAAHHHLLEALSFSPAVPCFELYRALVGIPLALHVGDQAALAQCAHPKTLELTFQSEVPEMIGGVACSFAHLYVSQGRVKAARELLHRAIGRIFDAISNLDLLVTIARYGAASDVRRARGLLAARAARPHSEIFQAGLALFDAFTKQHQERLVQARESAQIAAAAFDRLQWHGYAELARSIAPGIAEASRTKPAAGGPFSHLQPALTPREYEVAALVIRGSSNREIAAELNIALHTVEKHMNSIMQRLGVRSRYQVADLLESIADQ